MKKISIISTLFIFILFSCSKDDNTEKNIVVSLKKITSVNYTSSNQDYNNGLVSLEYNTDGKLKKIVWVNNEYSTFEYTTNQVKKISVDNHGGFVGKDTSIYDLNSNGLVTTVTNQNSMHIETLEYNSEGFLLKHDAQNPPYNEILTSVINGGNVVSITYLQGTTLKSTSTFEYYTDKLCNFNLDQTEGSFEDRLGIDCLGKMNKNLLKKSTDTSTTVGSQPSVKNYSYTFDSDGNVTRMTIVINGSITQNVDFTYL